MCEGVCKKDHKVENQLHQQPSYSEKTYLKNGQFST